MKYVLRLAVLAVILVPVAYTHAEVTTFKKSAAADMQAFDNLEERVASLENYSVTYKEADGQEEVMKSASARHFSKKGQVLTVELRPAKKKS